MAPSLSGGAAAKSGVWAARRIFAPTKAAAKPVAKPAPKKPKPVAKSAGELLGANADPLVQAALSAAAAGQTPAGPVSLAKTADAPVQAWQNADVLAWPIEAAELLLRKRRGVA